MKFYDDYEPINGSDLEDGQEIIVEHKRWDYKSGYPVESLFYRAIVGHHKTVSGDMFHLVNEPDVNFPLIAPWQSRWIYAGNNGNTQMWRRKK